MKILVVAEGVATRQWLGRLFNQTGLYFDQTSLYEIRFLKRIGECRRLILQSGHEDCRVIVWSQSTPADELASLAEQIPVAVVSDSRETSLALADSRCQVIEEELLDAMSLLEWMESTSGEFSPATLQKIPATY